MQAATEATAGTTAVNIGIAGSLHPYGTQGVSCNVPEAFAMPNPCEVKQHRSTAASSETRTWAYHGWPRASPQPLDAPLGQDSPGGGYHGLVRVCLGLHSRLYEIQGVCDAGCYTSAEGPGCNFPHQ